MKSCQSLQMSIRQLEICTAFSRKFEIITVAALINYVCKTAYWCLLSYPS